MKKKNFNLYYIKLFICFLLLVNNLQMLYCKNKDILWIYNWPQFISNFLKQPQPRLYYKDILLNDLICPSLTKLDLTSKKSIPNILNHITVFNDNKSNKEIWLIGLKDGIYWWNGHRVQSKDLKVFLEKNLTLILKEQFFYYNRLPKFQITLEKDKVMIKWNDDIKFGPYIFNNYPLWQMTDNGFECAGMYKPQIENDDINIINIKQPNKKIVIKQIQSNASKALQNNFTRYIRFNFASEYVSIPKLRAMEDPIKCSKIIDIPIVTGIIWNIHKNEYIKNPQLRQILTQIIPRGSLIRRAAGHLANIISAPILRIHPGYHNKVFVYPFSLNKAGDALMSLGFVRSFPKAVRKTPKGQNFELNIFIPHIGENSIVAKVIADNFYALGIKLNYIIQDIDKTNFETIDGILDAFYLPWPEINYIYVLHSKAATFQYPFWNIKDIKLDKLLEDYHLSLSMKYPNFNYLKSIHKYLHDQELFSIIMSHKVCVDSNINIKNISFFNTSWLNKLN